jgi:hypothetical protein
MDIYLEKYLENFESFDKIIVYKFGKLNGGIGDLTKFFIYLLQICIKYNIRLYYLLLDNEIDNFLQLKYTKMYLNTNELKDITYIRNINQIANLQSNMYYIVTPNIFYNIFKYDNILISLNKIFTFSDIIIKNAKKIIDDKEYISVHLRLGDKHLEVDKKYVCVQNDEREFNEQKLFDFLENNKDKTILFFCDNETYRKKIKERFNVTITNFKIGHTSFIITSELEIMNTVTEFYLLANSIHIYKASYSGFSIMASKFMNIPITDI